MAKTLDEAIDAILGNYEGMVQAAMERASQQAREDIDFKARSCLFEYYDNFDPKIYGRTGALEGAFVPYMEIGRGGGKIKSSVGMSYHSSNLDGVYSGSQKYTPTDGSWVLNNYLEGIHPTTNGAYRPEFVEYIPISDSKSPTTKMTEYLNKYIKDFNRNFWASFFS